MSFPRCCAMYALFIIACKDSEMEYLPWKSVYLGHYPVILDCLDNWAKTLSARVAAAMCLF